VRHGRRAGARSGIAGARVVALIAGADDRRAHALALPLLVCLLRAGVGIGEVIALRPEDVDLIGPPGFLPPGRRRVSWRLTQRSWNRLLSTALRRRYVG
jgi:integrase